MTTQALELYRSAPRYLTARAVGDRVPGLLSGPLAPVRLVNRKDAQPLGPGWGRVRPHLSGICGSDLATLGGKSSFYFSPLVSLPFVPGHEVVGELLDDVDDLPRGTRIAL
ncbi:MAG TPA: alcohol dehydrogenase catalytic domain-containing protein, partial [Candidatus Limnocylindrales bacterium]